MKNPDCQGCWFLINTEDPLLSTCEIGGKPGKKCPSKKRFREYEKWYKKRIKYLEDGIRKYYMAIRSLKEYAGERQGVICVTVMCGNEEGPVARTFEELKKAVLNLPLDDYAC